MAETIMPAFVRFPNEAAIIGRLLAGYGELEFDICQCVGEAVNDRDAVLKAMFRCRGEKERIDVGDALGRVPYRKLKLETQFSEAIASAHYCRQIRNKFAHCHWLDDVSGRLAFVTLPEIAFNHDAADLGDLTINYVDVPLLQAQESYFRYTARCLHYVHFQGMVNAGKKKDNPFGPPPKQARPPFGLLT